MYPVWPREISRYALGAEILQFETGAGPNFEFQLSGAKTEGGGITLWVGRHQPASHVAPAVDRQPGLRREDSLVGAQTFSFLFHSNFYFFSFF